MKETIQELQKIARELREESEKMAIRVRENAKQSYESAEAVLQATHRMHAILFTLPDRLIRIAQKLEGKG